MIQNILLAFIPIFVAVDAIGVLPVFVSLTEDLNRKEKQKIIGQSIVTAMILAVLFISLGKVVFKILGVTISDFMIAGGILLFSIALLSILIPEKKKTIASDDLGAVPLGTPLIVGPAVLTTSMIMMDQYGLLPTIISVLLNIIIAGIIFSFSEVLINILGKRGTRAMSKITALLLSAIAIMLIRKGILMLIG
ncbi:MAG: MarC family protein [Candidatus Omnitrophota bacterium]